MQHILGLVRRCAVDYNMIEAGETVAVGVSGGKDSLLTLTALPCCGTLAQFVGPLASCEFFPPEMELHSSEENDIRAARFASRAAQEILLLRRY